MRRLRANRKCVGIGEIVVLEDRVPFPDAHLNAETRHRLTTHIAETPHRRHFFSKEAAQHALHNARHTERRDATSAETERQISRGCSADATGSKRTRRPSCGSCAAFSYQQRVDALFRARTACLVAECRASCSACELG